jgi:hypothetical protein
VPDQPEAIATKIKDEPNGDFAILTEDPTSGNPVMIEGNHLDGNARAVDPLTGEVLGTIESGPIATEPAPGTMTPAADPLVGSTEPVYGPTEQPIQGPAKPPPPAVDVPASRTLDLEALIESETELDTPYEASEALDPNEFAEPTARRTVTSLEQVDLTDMTLDQEAAYTTRFPNYIKDQLAAGRLPRLGNLRDFIRYRYGRASGQLVPKYQPKLRATNPYGMSIEARVGIEAGRSAESMQAILRDSPTNKKSYSRSFFDPVRQKAVQKTVIPDFMPTAERDAAGRFVTAAREQDALVIADSKYTWDPEGRVALDDQVAAMMILARDNKRPFVFLLGEGRDVSPSVRAFAQAEGVEIYVVPDTSGNIR